MRKINVCIFKKNETKENALSYQEINADIHTYYDLIECETFTIVQRDIGNRTYGFIVDDEALLYGTPILSYLDPKNLNCNIFGNIIIVNAEPDEEGYTIGITEEDYEYISKFVYALDELPAPFICCDPSQAKTCILING